MPILDYAFNALIVVGGTCLLYHLKGSRWYWIALLFLSGFAISDFCRPRLVLLLLPLIPWKKIPWWSYASTLVFFIMVGVNVPKSEPWRPTRFAPWKANPDLTIKTTVADDLRFHKEDNDFTRAYYYVPYRLFYIPVDVSHRYYDAFVKYGPDPNIDWKAFVGLKYYWSRYTTFTKDVSAPASFDADAITKSGIFGVFMALGMLLFIRWLTTVYYHPYLSKAALLQMAFLLPQASTQAILGAYGLILWPLILKYWGKYEVSNPNPSYHGLYKQTKV